jgi:GDP-D-mannose 3', 5'-epimerase
VISGSVVVAGAGGFIGGHLAGDLLRGGYAVRAIDVKPFDEWFQLHPGADNRRLDLALREDARTAVAGADSVYNLAADMGGIGFISQNKASCMLSVLISTHLLQAAAAAGVRRFFFASSACVYNVGKQAATSAAPLRESDAYPAMAEDGYGWEKLFSERMARHYREDLGLETRIARYHNVYGTHGAWRGGREKAPAALARKVVEAIETGTGRIEIWGDGTQTRTFTHVSDCLRGTRMIMDGDYPDPLNVGSAEVVSIDRVVDLLEDIAGVALERTYCPTAPVGVAGRSSDNTLIREVFDWEPSTPLREGLAQTFEWVRAEYRTALLG